VVTGYIYWDAVKPELQKIGLLSDAPAPISAATPPPVVKKAPTAPTAEVVKTPEPKAPAVSTAAPAPVAVTPRQSVPMPQQIARAQAPALSEELRRDWAAARKAYWRRDMKKAIELYEALIKAHPKQADAIGELGNIYFMMGNRDKAAETYLAAGDLLVALDRPLAANKALTPLRMLSPEKADALRSKIFEASNKAANQ